MLPVGMLTQRRKIAVIDHKIKRAGWIRGIFGEDYDCRVAYGFESADKLVLDWRPAVVLIAECGWEYSIDDWLSEHIAQSDAPAIVLAAARVYDGRLVTLVNAGASHYTDEWGDGLYLRALVDATLRRLEWTHRTISSEGKAIQQIGTLTIDRGKHTVLVDGNPVKLSPGEWRVLNVLAKANGDLVDHRQFTREVFPDVTRPVEDLRVYVSSLRLKLGRDSIVNLAGHGYRIAV